MSSVRGFWLNKAFNELRHPEAREQWRSDLDGYLDRFPLSDEEKQLVRAADWAGCVDAGASVYTLTKVGATTGESLLHMGARMRGQTMEQFQAFVADQNERNRDSWLPFTTEGGQRG
jgi:protocatechuate 4,5-dioxygenase alpha chain